MVNLWIPWQDISCWTHNLCRRYCAFCLIHFPSVVWETVFNDSFVSNFCVTAVCNTQDHGWCSAVQRKRIITWSLYTTRAMLHLCPWSGLSPLIPAFLCEFTSNKRLLFYFSLSQWDFFFKEMKTRFFIFQTPTTADHSDAVLRHELSSFARTLGSWVQIPLKVWKSVCAYSVCG
jgi:hypothetical protein